MLYKQVFSSAGLFMRLNGRLIRRVFRLQCLPVGVLCEVVTLLLDFQPPIGAVYASCPPQGYAT